MINLQNKADALIFAMCLTFAGLIAGLGFKDSDNAMVTKEVPLPPPIMVVTPDPVSQEAPERELSCLALNVYHEARGESIAGQIAVASVVLNRVEHPEYPDSVCAVVYQRNQFSWTHELSDPTPHERNAWNTARMVASFVYNGRMRHEDLPQFVSGATHYHSTAVRPGWRYQQVATIDNHTFYRQ